MGDNAQSLLTQIEDISEKLLSQALASIGDFDAETATPDEPFTIAKLAQRLGFDLLKFDGSLVARAAFNAVGAEALYLSGYSEVRKPTPRRARRR
jgi:hypothetical protein